MDFEKRVILKEIEDMSNTHPKMTMGEILYSILRPQGDKNRTNKLSDLLNLSDEIIQTQIEKAKQAEIDG